MIGLESKIRPEFFCCVWRDLFCKIQVWTLLPPLIDAQLHNIGGKYEYWFSLFSNFSSSFSLVGKKFYWKRYRNCCETFQCIFYVPQYETIFKTCFWAIKGSSDLKKNLKNFFQAYLRKYLLQKTFFASQQSNEFKRQIQEIYQEKLFFVFNLWCRFGKLIRACIRAPIWALIWDPIWATFPRQLQNPKIKKKFLWPKRTETQKITIVRFYIFYFFGCWTYGGLQSYSLFDRNS